MSLKIVAAITPQGFATAFTSRAAPVIDMGVPLAFLGMLGISLL